jgi:16S rRNA C967 or C1407 C5-methylase (RsmB/RsmF family)
VTVDLEPSRATSPPLSRLLEQAADAVLAVRRGRSLTDVLGTVPAQLRPGVQALAFHVLRRLGAAQAVREILAPKAPPAEVDALLLTGIALLWPDTLSPYPDHTLVDQAVNAARRRAPRAAAFVNAILRRFVREREALAESARRVPSGAWNHPAWWIAAVQADWPAHWQSLLAADQEHAPMALRVNARQATGAQYVEELRAAGCGAVLAGAQAVVLETPVPVDRLPGFAQGRVSVQDLSAQRAAVLLVEALAGDPAAEASTGGNSMPEHVEPGNDEDGPFDAPRLRVLDACAAPGGKTAHLVELADVDVLALDVDALRLTRVDETLRRLGLGEGTSNGIDGHGDGSANGARRASPIGNPDVTGGDSGDGNANRPGAGSGHGGSNGMPLSNRHAPRSGRGWARTLAADARRVQTWWDGRLFDAILLDAPCSASGIVRRHPDIRWLRRPEDIPALARLQAELLEALWPTLRPGGWLLYATCSTFRAEGQQQIDAFLQRHGPSEASLDPRSPGHLLPLPDNGPTVAGSSGSPVAVESGDGFFYALLRKATAAKE